jgi:hypothetical protein
MDRWDVMEELEEHSLVVVVDSHTEEEPSVEQVAEVVPHTGDDLEEVVRIHSMVVAANVLEEDTLLAAIGCAE